MGATKKALAERGLKGAAARKKKAAEGRMAKRDALIHWRNPALTVEEAIALMTGWTPATAYRELKSRGLPPGRRSKT
jgi:hypothetical protein